MRPMPSTPRSSRASTTSTGSTTYKVRQVRRRSIRCASAPRRRCRPAASSFQVAKGAPQVILDLAKPRRRRPTARCRRPPTISPAAASAPSAWRGPATTASGSSSAFCRSSTRRATIRPQTIAEAKQMGLQVRMVTGDHTAIAKEIAGKLGLGTNIVSAHEIFDDNDSTGDASAHRRRRRLRRSVSRAQVQDRPGPAEGRPHRRHDRRRRQRRAAAEAGGHRHRGERRHRCGAGRRRSRAHRARPVRDRPGDRGGAPHLRADDELRDVPHRRDDPRPAVHDAVDPRLRLLSR